VQSYVWPTVPPDSILGLFAREPIAALAWTTREENRSAQVVRDDRVQAALRASYRPERHGEFIVWLSTDTTLVRAH
jgi:hypothetical protein